MGNYLKDELYAQVRLNDELFEFLQEGSLDGIWYWDLEKPENEWMSPRFWTTLGYDPATKKHKTHEWQDIIHPEDLQIALDNLEKHKHDPAHLYDQVVRYKHADGHTAWIRCRGKVIYNEKGKPIRLLGAHIDVTELKVAQLEIENYQKTMAQMTDKVDSIYKILDT